MAECVRMLLAHSVFEVEMNRNRLDQSLFALQTAPTSLQVIILSCDVTTHTHSLSLQVYLTTIYVNAQGLSAQWA